MTLKEALQYFKTKKELAEALGISKQAVSNWNENDPVPELQELKLRYEILPNLPPQETELQNV